MPRGNPLSEEAKDRIWELRAKGLSEREIGRRLGFPGVTISRQVNRFGGIRPRARRRPPGCLGFEGARRSHAGSPAALGPGDRKSARPLSHHDRP